MSIKQAIEALPELPVCTHCVPYPGPEDILFTAEQMREYALAALRSMPAEPVPGAAIKAALTDFAKSVQYQPTPPPAPVLTDAEIIAICMGTFGMAAHYDSKLFHYGRAVEQATAARLGVKMGDV